MFSAKAILNRLEFSPLLFSIVHCYGHGADINRRVFVNLVRPGDVVIEVGANRGVYTTLFSRLVGATGKVHAFEPVSESFHRLIDRLHSINATNVLAWQMGVAENGSSEREIIIPGDDSQQASLVAHTAGSWRGGKTRRELVQMTSLDAYLTKQHGSHVDFVKLDVEGAELSVLKGGSECFSRFKPVLHLEIESEWLDDFGTTVDAIIQLLQSFGYNFAYQADATRLRGLRKVDMAALVNGPVSGDFVFSTAPLRE